MYCNFVNDDSQTISSLRYDLPYNHPFLEHIGWRMHSATIMKINNKGILYGEPIWEAKLEPENILKYVLLEDACIKAFGDLLGSSALD